MHRSILSRRKAAKLSPAAKNFLLDNSDSEYYTVFMRKTNAELLAILKASIQKEGSIGKWAAKHNIAKDVVSKSIRATAIFPAVAEALGFHKTQEIWEASDDAMCGTE